MGTLINALRHLTAGMVVAGLAAEGDGSGDSSSNLGGFNCITSTIGEKVTEEDFSFFTRNLTSSLISSFISKLRGAVSAFGGRTSKGLASESVEGSGFLTVN